MRSLAGAILGTIMLFDGGVVVAEAAAEVIGCTATQDFYCDAAGCTSSSEPYTIEAGLSLDMATGAGSLCEYSQCRDFTATRLGSDEIWEGLLTLGPSNFTLRVLSEGREVDEKELRPSGAQLTIDLRTHDFLLSQQSGTGVGGYFGTCE